LIFLETHLLQNIVNKNPTAKIPHPTTAMNVAISAGLKTLRKVTISGNDKPITAFMKAERVLMSF
jgi:hypothetical protein